ncbi:hypothetical protein M885DRAFT_578851 [Pelagophyceae sp. CCMP2097]|nr:hypothetical protein M885DRAFT_578851 [Pelagophyceae sp. CCMP2097]
MGAAPALAPVAAAPVKPPAAAAPVGFKAVLVPVSRRDDCFAFQARLHTGLFQPDGGCCRTPGRIAMCYKHASAFKTAFEVSGGSAVVSPLVAQAQPLAPSLEARFEDVRCRNLGVAEELSRVAAAASFTDDSASAFFSSLTVEVARVDAATEDLRTSSRASIQTLADSVARSESSVAYLESTTSAQLSTMGDELARLDKRQGAEADTLGRLECGLFEQSERLSQLEDATSRSLLAVEPDAGPWAESKAEAQSLPVVPPQLAALSQLAERVELLEESSEIDQATKERLLPFIGDLVGPANTASLFAIPGCDLNGDFDVVYGNSSSGVCIVGIYVRGTAPEGEPAREVTARNGLSSYWRAPAFGQSAGDAGDAEMPPYRLFAQGPNGPEDFESPPVPARGRAAGDAAPGIDERAIALSQAHQQTLARLAAAQSDFIQVQKGSLRLKMKAEARMSSDETKKRFGLPLGQREAALIFALRYGRTPAIAPSLAGAEALKSIMMLTGDDLAAAGVSVGVSMHQLVCIFASQVGGSAGVSLQLPDCQSFSRADVEKLQPLEGSTAKALSGTPSTHAKSFAFPTVIRAMRAQASLLQAILGRELADVFRAFISTIEEKHMAQAERYTARWAEEEWNASLQTWFREAGKTLAAAGFEESWSTEELGDRLKAFGFVAPLPTWKAFPRALRLRDMERERDLSRAADAALEKSKSAKGLLSNTLRAAGSVKGLRGLGEVPSDGLRANDLKGRMAAAQLDNTQLRGRASAAPPAPKRGAAVPPPPVAASGNASNGEAARQLLKPTLNEARSLRSYLKATNRFKEVKLARGGTAPQFARLFSTAKTSL